MSPLRKYLDSRGYQYSAAVVIYAEIVAVTVVAAIVLGFAGVYLYGEFRSANGLSGPEITLLVSAVLAALNQVSVWRVGAQAKAIGQEVNGNRQQQLLNQTEELKSHNERLHNKDKREES